ncbi:MAG: transketolase, partial [Acidobacteriota bacterium]
MKEKARRGRELAIDAIYRAQSGHPGSSLSTMEMLVSIYFGGILRHNPKNPQDVHRDYFLLSNGHACPGLYAVLAMAGYFPEEDLLRLRQLGANVQGHPHRGSLPGIEISAGSLGQGLSVGIGLAHAHKLARKKNTIYVMMSDGEQQEGSTWEAVMYAPKRKLSNLVAIVDKNKFQIDGATQKVMPGLDPLAKKYKAFNWRVMEIDGHNFTEVFAAFQWAEKARGPAVIISNTIRGKDVSYMEGSEHWHAGAISDEQY